MQRDRNAAGGRRLVVTEFLSLDGVMEAPENWHKDFHNEEAQRFKHDELFASDAMVLGRTTYEIFAGAWPSRTDETGFAERMNSMKKYVVSRTLTEPAWTNTSVLANDLASEIPQLKPEPGGDLLVCGSGQLVRGLLTHGLVDEIRLLVDPVILGSGTRLFDDGGPRVSLELTDSRPLTSGSVLLTYHAANDLPV